MSAEKRRPGTNGTASQASTAANSTSVPRSADTICVVRHGDVEAEVWAAYLDGFAAGLAEANRRMSEALEAALAGPNGYGLTGRAETAGEIVRRLGRVMEVRT